ncbi:MAG TPA: hypothetical protein VHO25_06210, partial [Polyangiaceae bacterium]|nr:hypothetical protein [Polyangiaceae bacterium]
MAISFVSGIFRNNSRIRLFFDADLAGLAFQSFWFTVETSGNESPPVTVLAAVAVIGHPGAIELALNQELIPDVTYQVHIQAGLPGFTDMAPELNLELRTPGAKPSKRNTGSLLPDLYGEDITWRT